jgi:hypothetical protein
MQAIESTTVLNKLFRGTQRADSSNRVHLATNIILRTSCHLVTSSLLLLHLKHLSIHAEVLAFAVATPERLSCLCCS